MGVKLTKLPKLNTKELTEREALLLQIIREMQERIGELEDEVPRLNGEKGKPQIKPSRLEPKDKAAKPETDAQESSGEENSDSQKNKKRPYHHCHVTQPKLLKMMGDIVEILQLLTKKQGKEGDN
jgi:uncharacterized small protein (DUF1192 family)